MGDKTGNHKQLLLASLVAVILLGSSMFAQNFSVYADKGSKDNDDKKNKGTANNNSNEHDEHKKGKKDPDHDKDNDRKSCEKHGDTLPNGKYRHNCDSDHDHFA